MSKNALSVALASISGNVINCLTVFRRTKAIFVELVSKWGTGPFLSSILLEDTLFVAQLITDFRMTEYAVKYYFNRTVHPKTYALVVGIEQVHSPIHGDIGSESFSSPWY